MQSFDSNPIIAILLITMVITGFFGLFVIIPIAALEWGWNAFFQSNNLLPAINSWQAALLYIAIALVLYILGLVRIKIEIRNNSNP